MISKNRIKFIASLQKKKVRDDEKLYVIEGDKLVKEFLSAGIRLRMLVAKPEFISGLPAKLIAETDEIEKVSYDELKQMSTLKTPHNALAVVQIPDIRPDNKLILQGLCAALDFVQDPGNLGTIIRAAGWFGIKNIVCSEDCVDVYNPKVIQASMGAIMHVNVFYCDLIKFLDDAKNMPVPVFGTLLEGTSIYTHALSRNGVILLGNESKGISDDLLPFVTEKIKIPKFNSSTEGIDSLNVGMAASIVFSEFMRKSGIKPDF